MLRKSTSSMHFILPEGIRKTEVFGYDLQKKAALAIGLSVLKGGEHRVLVFGLPGSGVGQFPFAVLWELKKNHGAKFSLIHLKCENIILESNIEKIIARFDKTIREKMMEDSETPTAFLLDKPEALSRKLKNFHTNKVIVTRWLSHMLRRKFEKTLMFCTSDDPSSIDRSLIESFKTPLYLRYLDLESLKTIFRSLFSKRTDNEQIAKGLYREMDDEEFKLVSAEVIKATEEAKFTHDLKSLSTSELKKVIIDHVIPCYPQDYVNSYEERNRTLISRANLVSKYWSSFLE